MFNNIPTHTKINMATFFYTLVHIIRYKSFYSFISMLFCLTPMLLHVHTIFCSYYPKSSVRAILFVAVPFPCMCCIPY